MEQLYLNYNGTLIQQDQPVIRSSNRSFRYGDGVFETIRVINGKPQLLEKHFQRLLEGCKILNYELSSDQQQLHHFVAQVKTLIEKNLSCNNSRIRFSIFRNDGGFYTPNSNAISFLIEINPLLENEYTLNTKGLLVDIYPDIKKAKSLLSKLKSSNALLYVLASNYALQHKWDDSIIVNDKGNIVEATNSNIFAVKNGVLYTPPIDEGCVDGVMRSHIIKVAFESKIAVYEIPLAMNVLLNADELFLTNAINGIKWIGAYKVKRYFNNTSKLLIERLNQDL